MSLLNSVSSNGAPEPQSRAPATDSASSSPATTDCELLSKFQLLPTELRLKIWSYSKEPRIVILDDLVKNIRAYPLPSATQLNCEARHESREGYEPVGRGSHIHFSRDILVCDANIAEQSSNKPLEELAPRVYRLAFWDCFPDDGRVDGPISYSSYIAGRYPQEHFGKVEFDKFWFPNLRDLWIVKIGDVDRSWTIGVDEGMPYEVRLRKTARQFRYWIRDKIVEIATLDLDEPETKAVLTEGRCVKEDCKELNRGRSKMVSKVIFMDESYQHNHDAEGWERIVPWSTDVAKATEKATSENRMRWIIVERILTFSLRWEGSEELEEELEEEEELDEELEASSPRRQITSEGTSGRRQPPSTGHP